MQPSLYRPPLPAGKILDSTNFNFEETAIIRPPFEEAKNTTVGNKFTRVVIDSRNRDRSIYPNPNKYVIDMETDIQETTSGEILIKDIPLSMYMINQYNNTFTVNGESVVLAEGNYASGTLLAPVLNIALGSFSINVSYEDAIDKFMFRSNSEFLFTFPVTSDLALILGFVPGSEVEAKVSNALTSFELLAPFRINLTADRFAVMRIEHFTINNSINPVLHKSSALIGKADALGVRTLTPMKKWFNPPIARLLKLMISFTDFYGNPYDFQNQDHRIEIMFESKKHLSRYTSFV